MDWRLLLGLGFLALLAGVVAWGTSLQRAGHPEPVCSPDPAEPHLSIRAVDDPDAPHGGYAFWVVNPTGANVTFFGGSYQVRTLEVLRGGLLRELPTAHANVDFVEGYHGTTVPPGGEERWGAGSLPGAAEYVVEAQMEGMCGSARLRGR